MDERIGREGKRVRENCDIFFSRKEYIFYYMRYFPPLKRLFSIILQIKQMKIERTLF